MVVGIGHKAAAQLRGNALGAAKLVPAQTSPGRGATSCDLLIGPLSLQWSALAPTASAPSGPSLRSSPNRYPLIGRPFRLPLAALANQFPDFFLHQQIHQLQAGLTD